MITPEARYMNIDPRQLGKFLRSPDFVRRQSSTSIVAMERRVKTGRWSQNERIVYHAVREGYTTMDSLPVATGLTTQQIQEALTKLAQKGEVVGVK